MLIFAPDLMFFSRLVFEPVRIYQNLAAVLHERFQTSEVMKHSMLSIAFLYRSLYDKAASPTALQSHAQTLHEMASKQLQSDLQNPALPPAVKLSGLMEVLFYEVGECSRILKRCLFSLKLYSIVPVAPTRITDYSNKPSRMFKV